MPLNTLRKDRSKYLSGRAIRMASCLFILSVLTRFTDSSVLIAKFKKCQVNMKLTNKNIFLYLSETKTRNMILGLHCHAIEK